MNWAKEYQNHLDSLPVRSSSGVERELPEVVPSDVVLSVGVKVDDVRPAVAPHPQRQVSKVLPFEEIYLQRELIVKNSTRQTF